MSKVRIPCECGFKSGDKALKIWVGEKSYHIPYKFVLEIHRNKASEVIGITIPTWLAKDRGLK